VEKTPRSGEVVEKIIKKLLIIIYDYFYEYRYGCTFKGIKRVNNHLLWCNYVILSPIGYYNIDNLYKNQGKEGRRSD